MTTGARETQRVPELADTAGGTGAAAASFAPSPQRGEGWGAGGSPSPSPLPDGPADGTARGRRLAALRAAIPACAPAEALALCAAGALLVDVREAAEWATGVPEGALPLSRGFLELHIEGHAPLARTILLLCASGSRSLLAAADLRALGYEDVRSVAGGIAAWRAAGLPLAGAVAAPGPEPELPGVPGVPGPGPGPGPELPGPGAASPGCRLAGPPGAPSASPLPTPSPASRPLLTPALRARYARHLALPEIGAAGQERLLASRVLVVGAGGLGSPAAFYLAAAGVGTLGLVDFDQVDVSNLQRQILHTEARIGTAKVDSAAIALAALNPGLRIERHALCLTAANVDGLIAGHGAVVDGTDNLAARYLLNDACVRQRIPLVSAAVYRFEGQCTVYWPAYPGGGGPCYRCLFPVPAPAAEAPAACVEAGVLGAVTGVLGSLQAVEAVKCLLGVGQPLVGRLLHYDARAGQCTEIALRRAPACPACGATP